MGSFLLATLEAGPALDLFTSRYQQRFGEAHGPYAAEVYDAATAFLHAVEAGYTTASEINMFLAGEVFIGVSRTVQFLWTGENRAKPVYVYKATGGKLTLLGDASTAGG